MRPNEIPLPNHLKRFRCMMPRIGNSYRNARHKRLLILGESHYLPKCSDIHDDTQTWYSKSESDLKPKEMRWVSTEKIISSSLVGGFKIKGHLIYKNIAKDLNRAGLDLENPNNAINHISFYNYFLRPAKEKSTLKIEDQDKIVASEVLEWFIGVNQPELIIITSNKAGQAAKELLNHYSIPYIITPHPACHWWNRDAKKYRNLFKKKEWDYDEKEKVRGRDIFSTFLQKNQWMCK